MFKIDKFSAIMLGAIILAISMLVYNPLQQAFLLNQVKQIVIENNELLLQQARDLANVSHADQLLRHQEHDMILTKLTNLVENHNAEMVKSDVKNEAFVKVVVQNQKLNSELLKGLIKNQTRDIKDKLSLHVNETAENLNLTKTNNAILKNTNEIMKQRLIPLLENMSRGG